MVRNKRAFHLSPFALVQLLQNCKTLSCSYEMNHWICSLHKFCSLLFFKMALLKSAGIKCRAQMLDCAGRRLLVSMLHKKSLKTPQATWQTAGVRVSTGQTSVQQSLGTTLPLVWVCVCGGSPVSSSRTGTGCQRRFSPVIQMSLTPLTSLPPPCPHPSRNPVSQPPVSPEHLGANEQLEISWTGFSSLTRTVSTIKIEILWHLFYNIKQC